MKHYGCLLILSIFSILEYTHLAIEIEECAVLQMYTTSDSRDKSYSQIKSYQSRLIKFINVQNF